MEKISAKDKPCSIMPKATAGTLLGGEMNPAKVMEDPVDIEALLEALFLFGIGVGFSAIGRTPPAQGGIEGFQMIGMDRGVFNRRRSLRMLPARGLIFRPLAAALMGA